MHVWKAGSAYLYILHLDRPALAWEYLRRNAVYRRQWREGALIAGDASSVHWGCSVPENPDVDGRDAQPIWISDPPEIVRVTASERSIEASDLFSVWALPGRRRLSYAHTHLELHATRALDSARLRMDHSVVDGNPYAYVVRADGLLRERLHAVCQYAERFGCSRTTKRTSRPVRFDRHALTHTRTLQAVDGAHAGASHRDIAVALFGATDVSQRWTPDSELRAQVRYLIRRGRALVNGGYRSLLAHSRRVR